MNSERLRPISPENSAKVVSLSFAAAVAICVFHMRLFAPPVEDPALNDVRMLFSYPALSFFFAVSGYFLARRHGEPGWWRMAICKRIGTIAVPYCVWQLVSGVVAYCVEGRWTLRPGGFGLNPFVHPHLVPLWYLRNLMLLVVVSPILFWCLKRWGRWFVAILLAVWLSERGLVGLCPPSASLRLNGLLQATFSLQGLFAFGFGACLAWRPMTLGRRAGVWCGVAALALVFMRFALNVSTPIDWLIPTSCLVLAFAWTHVPPSRLPGFIAHSVFPIYLMHGIVLNVLCRAFAYDRATPLVELLAAVGVPVASSALLHRFAPRVARVVFGGR